MKAFWWFKEDQIAGMARPGFNSFRWLELPFQEALLLSWLGQLHQPSGQWDSLQKHAQAYGMRIYKYHKVTDDELERSLSVFKDRLGVIKLAERLTRKTQALKDFFFSGDTITFSLNTASLKWEMDELKRKGIDTIVALNEHHHNQDLLKDHFNLHHFSIEDLGPPRLEQVKQLAELLRTETRNQRKVAVHCLAGIGRTSTMLLTSHILLGEKADHVEALIKKQNPYYSLSPTQNEFVQTIITSGTIDLK